MQTKTLLTITGPSGSGKTELINMLCRGHDFSKLISVTTRPARPGEQDGVDYYFISKDKFAQLQRDKLLAQEVMFNGNGYGTTLDEFERIAAENKTPAVIVEPGGVGQFQTICNALGYRLYSLYVSAELSTLVDRYVARMAGETVTAESAKFHGRRISSIFVEHFRWPDLADYSMRLYNDGPMESLREYAKTVSNKIEEIKNGQS